MYLFHSNLIFASAFLYGVNFLRVLEVFMLFNSSANKSTQAHKSHTEYDQNWFPHMRKRKQLKR